MFDILKSTKKQYFEALVINNIYITVQELMFKEILL